MKRFNSILLIFILAIYGSTFTAVYAQSALTQRADSASVASRATEKTDPALPLTLPLKKDSVRFLAIGDTGRGNKVQNELAQVMVKYRQVFPYDFVMITFTIKKKPKI
jgi:hypothetical protein